MSKKVSLDIVQVKIKRNVDLRGRQYFKGESLVTTASTANELIEMGAAKMEAVIALAKKEK